MTNTAIIADSSPLISLAIVEQLENNCAIAVFTFALI